MSNQNRSEKTREATNFKVSNAALDLDSIRDSVNENISVWVKTDGKVALLATLSREIPQTQVDVAFGSNKTVEFVVHAKIPAVVHLSGYYIYDENDSSDESIEEKSPCLPSKKIGKR